MRPSEQQKYVHEQFRKLLSESRLRAWDPGDPTPLTGRRILVGVADYSTIDMALLDALDKIVSNQLGPDDTIQVFNVLDCTKMEDFEEYVPGIDPVYQTPVVGVWEEGQIDRRASGKPSVDLLRSILGLTDDLDRVS
jgi:hypothetical protein